LYIWEQQIHAFYTMTTKLRLSACAALLALILLATACQNAPQAPPFPAHSSEYAQPKTVPFEFTPEEKVEWDTFDLAPMHTWPTTKFNWEDLPEKPFDLGDPFPLKAPPDTIPLDWESLPDTVFDYNSLPKQDITVKTFPLGKPKVVKAGPPTALPGTSRGVLGLDDLGLFGTPIGMIKDNNGSIWIATNRHLVRYDSEYLHIYGEEIMAPGFRNIRMLKKDEQGRLWVHVYRGNIYIIDQEAGIFHQLSGFDMSLTIEDITEDTKGRVWLNDWGKGFTIIDLEDQTARKFTKKQGLASENAWGALFLDKSGLLWLSTADGISIIDIENNRATRLPLSKIVRVIQDESGAYWMAGEGGIRILNKEKNNMVLLGPKQGLETTGRAVLVGIWQDTSGKIWTSYFRDDYVYIYDEKSGLMDKIKVGDNLSVSDYVEDDQGQVWLLDRSKAIYIYNSHHGQPGQFTTEHADSSDIETIFQTSDDKVWLGSQHNGIDVYDPATGTIKNLGEEQGLTLEGIERLVEAPDGMIWIGSRNKLQIIDPKKGLVRQLASPQGLENDIIHFVTTDADGTVWIGGHSPLTAIMPDRRSFVRRKKDRDEIEDWIFSIHKDRKNQLWVGYEMKGLERIDLLKNTSIRLNTSSGLVGDRINQLMMATDNKLWIASDKGAQRIDPDNRVITTFTASEGLAFGNVNSLIEKGNNIFFGTSEGISILGRTEGTDANDEKWTAMSIGKSHGLTEQSVGQNLFLFDQRGRLWAGMFDNTLTVIDPIVPDTMPGRTYISGISLTDDKTVFRDREKAEQVLSGTDTLWAPGGKQYFLKGLPGYDSLFQPIKGVHWQGLEGPYNIPMGLELPHDQNFISFTFHGKQYAAPDHTVYRYMLAGLDKEWGPVTRDPNSENYRDLATGRYTFLAASKGFNGVWSPPASFEFVILPPWYQTWWAYALFFGLFVGTVYGIVQFRSRQLQKENRLLEEKVKRRTLELEKSIEELKSTQSQLIHSEKMASLGELTAGIAHEIQNPLNFVNNFSEVSNELIDEMNEELDKGDIKEAKAIGSDVKQNLEKIRHHGGRAADIVKGMLQHSRGSNNTKEPTDINALCDEYLRLAFHGLRAKDKSFNAEMKTSFDESIGKINVVPQDIGRVLLNLITNGFYAVSEKSKSAPEGYAPTLSITTKKEGDQVVISVADNGNGIPENIREKIFQPFFTTKPTGQGTGLGLSLSYDIVKAHGGEIKVESKEGDGTEFRVILHE